MNGETPLMPERAKAAGSNLFSWPTKEGWRTDYWRTPNEALQSNKKPRFGFERSEAYGSTEFAGTTKEDRELCTGGR